MRTERGLPAQHRALGRAAAAGHPAGHWAAAGFRALVEQAPAVLYVEVDDPSSPTGTRIAYMSPQVDRVLGYAAEAFMADPELWDRLIHPEDLPDVIAHDAYAEETGERFRREYRMLDSEGHAHWLRDEAVPVEDAESGGRRWQGVLIDVTEERRLIEELRQAEIRYRSLVESLPMCVFVDSVDDLSSNVYTSPQSEAITGYTAEEWTTDPALWTRVIHPDDRERVLEANRVGHPFFDEEYRLVRKDGRVIWVRDVSIDVVDEDGTPLYTQGFVMDVTEQKEAEATLAESLDRERCAAEELRSLDSERSRLLLSLSHDLREPLTAIIAGASALEMHGEQLGPSECVEVLRAIGGRARGMDETLTQLLDLDRLEQGGSGTGRRQVDLGAVVSDLMIARPRFARATVQVRPVEVWVDPCSIASVLDHLLENAERHTPTGSRLWVCVEPAEGGALLMVEDDGPGVCNDMKDAIFEPFRQVETPAAKLGMGVGLAYVKRHAKLHGGRAWVEDRSGGGASFRVFLPA